MSASTLSRWSQGSGDGLLASVLLATEVPVLVAAAMNTAMWSHPAVQQNWQVVQAFPGVVPLLPASGLLACDRRGDGRMADPILIELAAAALFSRGQECVVPERDWEGKHLLVTAGATHEPIDQARVLTNRSTGHMGVLLAQVARLRGAIVHLVHGPLSVPEPWCEGIECIPVTTADDMARVLVDRQPSMDAIAMVAAVADLRRVESSETKVSKQRLPELLASGWSQVPDLLASLSKRRPQGQILLGFAALAGEDAALIAQGKAKLNAKGCDLLMVNPIDRLGQGFGDQANGGWLLDRDTIREMPLMSKLSMAHQLLDAMHQSHIAAIAPVDGGNQTSC
jgi:phosphopantothenoylcysteine decarboxylase/phosphopantothenate--cysteine ligase